MRGWYRVPCRRAAFLLVLTLIAAAAPSFDGARLQAGTSTDGPPPAPPRRVVDVYWGQEVIDDYQYLEDVGNPAVREWAVGQNTFTRTWLDEYPLREAIAKRVRSLTHHVSPDFYSLKHRGGKLFAIKRQPPKQQSFLVVIPALDGSADQQVVVDPNVIDPTGHTSIDFYVPSHDGRLVAVSLSKDGTEDGTVVVYEVASGRRLDDEIPRVNGGTAGGSVAWTPGNDGFYYTRYPYPGERPDADLFFYQQIWFHRLGAPLADDHYVLGESFPRIAEIELETSDDGRYVLAEVSDGDGGEYEFWLKGPDADWVRFAQLDDWVQKAHFGADGAIYLLSRQDAPRKQILRLDVERPELAAAETIVPETDAVVIAFLATVSRLYVIEMVGGPSQLREYDLAGRALGTVEMGAMSRISGLVAMGGDEILLRRQTYTTPPAWYRHAPGMSQPRVTTLARTSSADYRECEVRRIFATADDGTEVPINIILRRDTPLDGSAPLLLYGYGSYGNSQQPYFKATRLAWIEQGGIYAVANIRGGGEFGDAWHRAANLERKKVSMDDFAACARHLVEAGYTSADRLAIEGGSAGGLLVYGTMAHYPDRLAAVVSRVGISDALRTELSPNGEFNITEFGTVKNEKQFPGMLAASPLHQLRDGVKYPAVLSLTGMNDPRVEPWQSFKMTARLQATGTDKPVLLRVSMDTGHGSGTSLAKQDAQQIDILTFLFKQLGLKYRPVTLPDPSD